MLMLCMSVFESLFISVCVYCTCVFDPHDSSHTPSRKLIWHESKIKLKTKWKTQLSKYKHTFFPIEHLCPYRQYVQWYLLHLARLLNKSYLFSMFELNYISDVLTMIRWLPSFYFILLFFWIVVLYVQYSTWCRWCCMLEKAVKYNNNKKRDIVRNVTVFSEYKWLCYVDGCFSSCILVEINQRIEREFRIEIERFCVSVCKRLLYG